jgi:hypothetical protein
MGRVSTATERPLQAAGCRTGSPFPRPWRQNDLHHISHVVTSSVAAVVDLFR